MNGRPSHEPTRNFHPSHRLRDDAARNTRSLGCLGCPDFKHCGGLHTDAGIFDCSDLCSCEDRSKCDVVCRNKPQAFFERLLEVDGFDFGTVPHVMPLVRTSLPNLIPFVGHKYSRSKPLVEPVVAVPLYELFHLGTGQPHVRSRAELSERLLVPHDAIVVATGVDRDTKVEAWWAFADRDGVMQTLRDLDIALVTTPNFSLFTNVPRPDNLHGMKRIAMSWAELMAAGVPAALHINGRTDYDYARWTRFVAERPEVATLAFEFGTGAGYSGRLEWHVDRLCQLASTAGRPLTMVVRGGVRALPLLRLHFDQVILIETDAFSRTLKRRRATITEAGRLRWIRTLTANGDPLDELLAHNTLTVRTAFDQKGIQPREGSGRAQMPIRRRAPYGDRQPAQASFVRELDAALQAGAVPAHDKRVILATKA